MKHIIFILVLLLTSVPGFTKQSNNKNTINSMETKQKTLVAFFSRAGKYKVT